MSNDDDKYPSDFSPNQARGYRKYLLTCRRLGIVPTSPERAKVLLNEWAAARRDIDPATGEVMRASQSCRTASR